VAVLPSYRSFASTRASSLTEIICGSVDVIDRIAPEWRALCVDGTHNEPFYRPEWIAAYLRAFEPQAKVVLVTVRRGGQLRAVLPLVEDKVGLFGVGATRLRGPVNEHSNRLDLIHGDGDSEWAIATAWHALANLSGWDVIDVRHVPDGGALHQVLDCATDAGYATSKRETLRSPYIPLADSAPAKGYSPPDASFRRNLRRGMRKLEAFGPVQVVRRDTVDAHTLERFFSTELAGWKGRSGTAIACRPETLRFYTDVANAASRLGYFALYELWCGDSPVAFDLGFTLQGRYFVPKVAYNEAFKSVGPGHLIVGEILRDLQGRQMTELDMLGHTDPYKARWTNVYRQHYHCHIFGRGPTGQAFQTWTDHVMPAGRKVHRKLRGLDGAGRGVALGTLGMIGRETVRWC
jgi:CelD/BcsL family acetyltransferase involved in cellulose biosynthesis